MPDRPLYIYLHGFASGPTSAKGVFLQKQLKQTYDIDLLVPDFNQGGFSTLTISRQIAQVTDLLAGDRPAVAIGSSLGGLTAAWVAERSPQIQQLVLLAPAFEFGRRWAKAVGPEALADWKTSGQRLFYHYGQKTELPLHYAFVEDALQYTEAGLQRAVPTQIIHGTNDDAVPVQVSRTYASDRPWVTLQEVDSDHSLGDAPTKTIIWQTVQTAIASTM